MPPRRDRSGRAATSGCGRCASAARSWSRPCTSPTSAPGRAGDRSTASARSAKSTIAGCTHSRLSAPIPGTGTSACQRCCSGRKPGPGLGPRVTPRAVRPDARASARVRPSGSAWYSSARREDLAQVGGRGVDLVGRARALRSAPNRRRARSRRRVVARAESTRMLSRDRAVLMPGIDSRCRARLRASSGTSGCVCSLIRIRRTCSVTVDGVCHSPDECHTVWSSSRRVNTCPGDDARNAMRSNSRRESSIAWLSTRTSRLAVSISSSPNRRTRDGARRRIARICCASSKGTSRAEPLLDDG